MAKKGNNSNNSRGASASAVAAFAASNPNSRTAQAASAPAAASPSRGASQSAVQAFAASNPNSRTAQQATQPAKQTAVQQINKQNTLSQNLRAASGANGVLSEKELLKISNVSGKNNEKVLEKAVGKGLMIGSKVVNQYQKGKYTDPKTAWYRAAAGSLGVATGFDSPILNQLRNAGRQDKGSALFIGSKGSTATTLPRRSGLGVGTQAQPLPTTPANAEQPVTTGEQPQDPITPFVPEQLPEEKPEEKMDPGSGMLSGGGMGAAGASKLGRAKSRLRQLGIYGRGTGLLGRGLQYGNALNA